MDVHCFTLDGCFNILMKVWSFSVLIILRGIIRAWVLTQLVGDSIFVQYSVYAWYDVKTWHLFCKHHIVYFRQFMCVELQLTTSVPFILKILTRSPPSQRQLTVMRSRGKTARISAVQTHTRGKLRFCATPDGLPSWYNWNSSQISRKRRTLFGYIYYFTSALKAAQFQIWCSLWDFRTVNKNITR